MKNNLAKGIKYSDSLLLRGALIPIIYFVIILGLFIVFIKIGSGKFLEQRRLITQAKTTENVLSDKLKYLNDNQDTLKNNKDLLTVALPEKNSILAIMSQIKNLQSSGGILITNIKVSGSAQDDSKKTNTLAMNVSVEGTVEEIVSFLETINNSLPVNKIVRIAFSSTGARYSADITINTYWEKLPIDIPSVTTPIKKLTKEELAFISTLQGMKTPDLRQMLPQSPTQRVNPFAQ